jgi:RNA polymerase sigma-70 factor (ECF subfamily)
MATAHLSEPDNQTKDKAYSIFSLVQKAREGNSNAFNELVDLYHKEIFRMVYYRVRSQADAEDLTQDIFFQAFKNISGLKTIEYFKSWLYRIAINRVRDFYRKKRFSSLIGIFSENEEIDENEVGISANGDSDPMQNIIRNEFWNKFESAVKCLSRMEKEVFMLRFVDCLGIKEISIAISKNESTVKTHLYRALGKLKKNAALKRFFNEEYK